MLKMYAQCLKILHRRDEYSRVLLNLLAKAAASEKSRLGSQIKHPRNSLSEVSKWLDDDNIDVVGQMTELIDLSSELPYNINAPMAKYFDRVVVDPVIHHFQEKDGFQMQVKFRHLFEDDIEAQVIKLRLLSTTAGQMRELWLQGQVPVRIMKGLQSFWLKTNVRRIQDGSKSTLTAIRSLRLAILVLKGSSLKLKK